MTNLPAILEHFPNFDYRQPKEPWRMDASHPESLADLQIQAFHYYWTLQATKQGNIGLSLITPHLPYCFTLSNMSNALVHRHDKPESLQWLFEPESFSCVVVSAVLPNIFCSEVAPEAEKKIRKKARCSGREVVNDFCQWGRVLAPGGVILGALFDEGAAQEIRKTSLIDELDAQHAWSAASFYFNVLEPFVRSDPSFAIEEYDTLKNNLAFNFVARRIQCTT